MEGKGNEEGRSKVCTYGAFLEKGSGAVLRSLPLVLGSAEVRLAQDGERVGGEAHQRGRGHGGEEAGRGSRRGREAGHPR